MPQGMKRRTEHERKAALKRARQDARDKKAEGHDIIDICSADEAMPDEAPPARDQRALKREIHHVLNAFQHSREYGVYVCEQFRDPRFSGIDAYFHEVEDCAHGIDDLRYLGPTESPLTSAMTLKLGKFAETLEALAARLRAAVQAAQ